MKQNVDKIIKHFIKNLTTEEKIRKNLLSFTVHGSCLELDNDNNYIDYDVIFIYEDDYISEALKSVDIFLLNYCSKITNNDTICFCAMKSGPMHPLRKNKEANMINLNQQRIIFFHISIFSKSDYSGCNPKTTPSPLLAYGWQKLQPIFGLPLSSFRKICSLNIENIISAGLGIDDCIEMIKTKSNGYWIWENNQMVWGKDEFCDFDEYEIAAYSLKWCVHNSTHYLSQILPLNIQKNSKKDLFIKHFLNQILLSDFLIVSSFCENIKKHRADFVNSPEEFKKKYDIENLNSKIISILLCVKEKLLSIGDLSEVKYKLPHTSKNISINISADLKKLLYEGLSKKIYDKVLLITDRNISIHYDLKPWLMDMNCKFNEFVIDFNDKSPSKLMEVLEFAEKSELTISSLIILLGGGNVGNLGGTVAGLCFRGIDFIHIPTTILAQLDSTIGCKQSVNGFISKNKFGLFHAPESININLLFNDTLDEIHIRSGLVEALKHGLCQSPELAFEVIEYCKQYLNNDVKQIKIKELESIVLKTIEYKLEYMRIDPFENSPEQYLELGHKIGHALEFASNENIPHGICVGFGMIVESYLFYKKNMIDEKFLLEIQTCVKQVINNINLDDKYLEKINCNILLDNKKKYNKIPFVLLSDYKVPKSIMVEMDKTINEEIEKAISYARSVI